MKKTLPLLVFVLIVITNIFAQNGITSYSPPNGVLARGQNCIKIDALGNKWIGFKKIGLGKFDGVSWTMFDTLNSSIPANQVNDVVFDATGNLWAATVKGLAKFDGTVWTTYDKNNSLLPDDSVTSLLASASSIWIGTKNGLAQFNGVDWTVFNTSNLSIAAKKIQCIAVETNNDLWVGTSDGLFKKSGNVWTGLNTINSNLATNNILSLYIDDTNDKWIGVENYGVYKYSGGIMQNLNSLFSLSLFPDIYSQSLSRSVYSITKGILGRVTFSAGGIIYEVVDGFLHCYNFQQLPAPINFYNSIAYDSKQNLLWGAGKLNGGMPNIYSFNSAAYADATLVPRIPGANSLDINEVNATLLNKGDIHWSTQTGGYEVPKGSGRKTIFASSLWMGGVDNSNQLHVSAMTYRQRGIDYWPGPLDTITGSIDTNTSNNFDKIWKVSRIQIEEFKSQFAKGNVQNGTYVDEDILSWPGNSWGNVSKNLAPFVDVNHDGIYSPFVAGDYPDIKGDQMCYWIFNDNLKAHTETGGLPLKVEVHASAYAFACPTIDDTLKALNYTTFYNYKIFNRSASNYHDAYLGIWQDGDLGSASDDYVGCNPSGNYGFIYNGDEVDDNPPVGQVAYGEKPPMLSTVILNGPLAKSNDGIDNNNNGVVDEAGEKNLMTNFMYYYNHNILPTGNPSDAPDYYNYMRSVWKDSTHLTLGDNGYGGLTETNFMFDAPLGILAGPKVLPWTESAAGNEPGNRKFLMGCGPFNLGVGENVELDYAIVYTRDEVSTYSIQNLYTKNKADVQKVQEWFALNQFPSCLEKVAVEENAVVLSELSLHPNPASDNITIKYNSPDKKYTANIYDVTGKLIKTMNYDHSSINTISVADFNSGMYLLNVSDGKTVITKRFIKQ